VPLTIATRKNKKPIYEVPSKTVLNTIPLILSISEDSVAFESIIRMPLVRVLS
jgi:hypothetical protein